MKANMYSIPIDSLNFARICFPDNLKESMGIVL